MLVKVWEFRPTLEDVISLTALPLYRETNQMSMASERRIRISYKD